MNLDQPFEAFWRTWPEEFRISARRSSIFARYQRVAAAYPGLVNQFPEAVRRYCEARRRQGRAISVIGFLTGGTFAEFSCNPPEIDGDGWFVVRPGRPEWSAWLGYQRNHHGQARVDQIVRLKRFVTPQRWPEGYPKQEAAE
ncbi:MAG: hypothetical protein KDJ90_00470 [Nitratireductor sp.]|nr:hypothetical protein [Nitratireductor sp.]